MAVLLLDITTLDNATSHSWIKGCHTFKFLQVAVCSVLLRTDGRAVACGNNENGQCDLPPLKGDLSYIKVSAGGAHTLLLQSDGSAVACGRNHVGQCNVPPLNHGMTYVGVSAGAQHTVLLRSDGSSVACGGKRCGQCALPPLDDGVKYIQVSAGAYHTVLLRSDGLAVACGLKKSGQCNIPPLKAGTSYTQVSAGGYHTVLLRSDGCAVACGQNDGGQCTFPSLDEARYTEVFAGGYHTVLFKSDGRNPEVVVYGECDDGQCDIPPPCFNSCYCGSQNPYCKDFVVQLDFIHEEDDTISLTCSNLAGTELLRLNVSGSERVRDIQKRIAHELKTNDLQLVLPDKDSTFLSICRAHPHTTVADLTRCKGLA